MPWSLDARVPVLFGDLADVGEGDAVLAEGDGVPGNLDGECFAADAPHPVGCACCLSRSPAATALDRLFQRRARGEVAFFRRVVALTATADGEVAVFAALRGDPVVAARYRSAGMS